ncbi:bifunctional glycosyltransferase/CDP-glycerol:glycerophosphate glycerophosphotransferase [Oceanobacillus sp. CAU 1775]
MINKGKISVIIPVYNTAEFIEECIDSLENQTYKNIEIILINDNSDNDCTNLLEHIASGNENTKLFHFSERKGVGAARNFGIEKSTGEFIYFLDSDDYLPEKTLEILITHIKDNALIKGSVRNTNFSNSMAIIFDGLFKVKHYTDNRYKLIENRSALNFLIRRDFIEDEGLVFSEEVEVFSDLSFMIPALMKNEVIFYLKEAVYFRRKRNDPISNPSLIQYEETKVIRDFLFVFNQLRDKYDNLLVIEYLDKELLNFYRKTIVPYFKEGEKIDELYPNILSSMKKVSNDTIGDYDWLFKKELAALRSGNVKKYKKINNRHQFLRDIRDGLKTRRKFYIFLYRRVFMKLKMKENVVFFESFLAKSYSDNPKHIYEYMLNNNMNYKFVWSMREKKDDMPGKPIQVERFSLKYFYYLATAKYWVSNSRMPKYLDKRPGNVYLQTWHGTPLKTLVFDINDIHSADPNYKPNFYEQSRRWDYLNSPNQYSSDIFRSAFKYEKEMLEFGYPRNDILYNKNNAEDIMKLKKNIRVPLDKKIILYAPTWRDDEFFSRGNYKFTLHLDLKKMQKEFGDEYILLLRSHYHIANQIDVSKYKGFVYDLSKYDDIAELYLISDMLITDYSSVFFDYAHLRRPILFYTYDLEKYRDQLRGMYLDMEEEVPGPLLMTTDEVVETIKDVDNVIKEYEAKYETFYNKFCLWDDGQASKKTVERVFEDS